TPGDEYDVLVAMNAAALKVNIAFLKPGGILILNTDGFDDKNLRLAKYDQSPLDDDHLASNYTVYKIPITQLTRKSLENYEFGIKEKDRSKNMFALGLVYWLFNRTTDFTEKFLLEKFRKTIRLAEAN